MKFFENIFSSVSYALNLAFWKNFTNLPISRDICLNRFLYKIKLKFLENWAMGFWCYVFTKCILYKYKNYCFWEYSAKISHSRIRYKKLFQKKNFLPKSTLNNGPIAKSSWQSFLNINLRILSRGFFKIPIRTKCFW